MRLLGGSGGAFQPAANGLPTPFQRPSDGVCVPTPYTPGRWNTPLSVGKGARAGGCAAPSTIRSRAPRAANIQPAPSEAIDRRPDGGRGAKGMPPESVGRYGG